MARLSIKPIGLLVVICIAMFTASGLLVSAGQAVTPEQQLADRYAPIAVLRNQSHACDSSGEGYFPAPVDLILGNPEISLWRDVEGSSTDELIMEGPTATDLAGLDESYYLDFPGDPNNAGCTYETDFKRFAAETDAAPTTYARIVVDPVQGNVVLQYWFWYYFNSWNNTHESDWEMVQIVFDADTVEEALAQSGPSQIGYAQHGGGELAHWEDAKLSTDQGRIVVFPAAGSHATYFGNETYIGWGENGTGFGCDTTTSPSSYVPLNVVLVPSDPEPDSEFGWMLYEGRWGELKSWEYSGPFGPNMGAKWLTPMASMEDWRDSSLSVPASKAIGPTATDMFCRLSSHGSVLITRFWDNPAQMVIAALSIIGVIGALFFTKRHVVNEAIAFYRQHIRIFLLIGLTTIPIGILFNGLTTLIRENPPVDWVIKWLNDTEGARLAVAAAVGGAQVLAMLLLVSPPVIVATQDILAGRTPAAMDCFRRGYRQLATLSSALTIVLGSVIVLVILTIGVPVAIWLSVRWQFFGQSILIDGHSSGRSAVRQSSDVVKGRWWEAFSDSLIFQLISWVPGPLVGLLLLLVGGIAVEFANALSSIVFAVTVPISVIGLTLAYLRFGGRMVPTSSQQEQVEERASSPAQQINPSPL